MYPAGRRLRVRGVEVHGSTSDRALAGQRTAINLSDIEPSELKRGDVLSEPGRFHAIRRVDCRLTLLPSAKPLKHRAPVHFHSGTAEIEAEVRLPSGTPVLRPGQTCYAQLVLREPALLWPGDRFIIRMFSPVVTIGGGVVVDNGERRYRAADDMTARLAALDQADTAARLALLVKEAPFGLGLADLVARTGLREAELAAAAARAGLVEIAQWYVSPAWLQQSRDKMTAAVREFHRSHPLLPGVPKQDLRSREFGALPLFLLDALLTGAKDLLLEGETVRARGHKVVLQEDENAARTAIERAFQSAGLATPAVPEVLAKSGVEPARARSLLQILLRERQLIRVSEDLVFHRSAIDSLRQMMAARKSARFNVTAFKEWTGVSRKYAIPLLEYLDRERITRREGDERRVL